MKGSLDKVRETQPEIYDLARRKLELSRQVHEIKLEMSKLHEALLRHGTPEALESVGCW